MFGVTRESGTILIHCTLSISSKDVASRGFLARIADRPAWQHYFPECNLVLCWDTPKDTLKKGFRFVVRALARLWHVRETG
jgi:hypothetical protein